MGTVERVTREWGRWSESHMDVDGESSYTGCGRWSELHGDGEGESSYTG